MVEDKLSKDWRTSKEGETYSYYESVKDQTLLEAAKKTVESKSKEPIEYDGYFFAPASFKGKDGKQVEMIFRFMEKEKAVAKLDYKGGNYAPKKDWLVTYSDIAFMDLNHKDKIMELTKKGYIFAPFSLVGNMCLHIDGDGNKLQALVLPYKIEIREQVQSG